MVFLNFSFELSYICQKISKAFEIYDTLRKELREEEFDKVKNECHCNLPFIKLTKKKVSLVRTALLEPFPVTDNISFFLPFKSLVVFH